MPRTKKKVAGKATIDVSLVVIRTGSTDSGDEIAIDTSNRIEVTPQTETTDPIRLMKLGRLIAQKLGKTTITGHQIVLRDNVFTIQIMKILQGGQITGDQGSEVYTPPVSGSTEQGEIFELEAYSAIYDGSGQIQEYEVITYPNCQGTPVTISTEDDVFRLPEYTINSAPNTGEAPYKISYTKTLPDFSSATPLMAEESGLQVQAKAALKK